MSTPRKKRSTRRTGPVTVLPAVPPTQQAMLTEVRELILTARQQVAQAVNARLTILHWQIGDRVHREVLKEKRADYGAEIVSALSRELEAEFGRGFGRRNLFNMTRFAEEPVEKRGSAVSFTPGSRGSYEKSKGAYGNSQVGKADPDT